MPTLSPPIWQPVVVVLCNFMPLYGCHSLISLFFSGLKLHPSSASSFLSHSSHLAVPFLAWRNPVGVLMCVVPGYFADVHLHTCCLERMYQGSARKVQEKRRHCRTMYSAQASFFNQPAEKHNLCSVI